MREYLVKTKKVGDCIVITLPKDLVQAEQIGADMFVKITVQKCQKGNFGVSKESGSSCSDDPWKQLE
jgi:hypothetical protein